MAFSSTLNTLFQMYPIMKWLNLGWGIRYTLLSLLFISSLASDMTANVLCMKKFGVGLSNVLLILFPLFPAILTISWFAFYHNEKSASPFFNTIIKRTQALNFTTGGNESTDLLFNTTNEEDPLLLQTSTPDWSKLEQINKKLNHYVISFISAGVLLLTLLKVVFPTVASWTNDNTEASVVFGFQFFSYLQGCCLQVWGKN